jgi:hypothetical protein
MLSITCLYNRSTTCTSAGPGTKAHVAHSTPKPRFGKSSDNQCPRRIAYTLGLDFVLADRGMMGSVSAVKEKFYFNIGTSQKYLHDELKSVSWIQIRLDLNLFV